MWPALTTRMAVLAALLVTLYKALHGQTAIYLRGMDNVSCIPDPRKLLAPQLSNQRQC